MIKLRSTRVTDDEPLGRRIIRGELEPMSLYGLESDWYQRGFISTGKLKTLVRSVEIGSEFPDITLGMRGHHFEEESGNSTGLVLFDPCYIIDGLQRWKAFISVLEKNPNALLRLGAKIYLDSTVEFENDLFEKLNTNHTKVAACVILRNAKEHSVLAATLYGVTQTDKDFALYQRVCWDQELDKGTGGELLRGNILLKLMALLHVHLIRGPSLMNRVLDMLTNLERRIQIIGMYQARANLVKVFDAIDEAWGIRGTPVKFGSIHLTDNWLQIVARIFNNHREFWDGNELRVSREGIKDLRKINPEDRELINLSRGNKAQHDLLYQMMINIMNKGKLAKNRYVDRDTLDKKEAERDKAAYTATDGAYV